MKTLLTLWTVKKKILISTQKNPKITEVMIGQTILNIGTAQVFVGFKFLLNTDRCATVTGLERDAVNNLQNYLTFAVKCPYVSIMCLIIL